MNQEQNTVPSRRTAVTIRYDKETFTARDVELTLLYFVSDMPRTFAETLASYVCGDITVSAPSDCPQSFEVSELIFGYAQATLTRLANEAGYNVMYLPIEKPSGKNETKAVFTKNHS